MDRFDTARALVLAAGARPVWPARRPARFGEKTGHQDLVTRCDRETEQFLRSGIIATGRRHRRRISATPPGGTGCVWYLDPIDGTTNFVSQHRKLCGVCGLTTRTVCLPSALCWTLNAAHCTPPGTAAAAR